MKGIIFFSLALIAIFWPDAAFAWGPATHLHYGISLLDQLSQLTDAVRALLASQSFSFLYGSVSADIVLAKKLGRAATHCHNWENGMKLVDSAESDRTRAFALGYVSHLAADTISHNCYVPSKTISSYETGILNHMYWELLFDQQVTSPKTIELFRQIARGDFTDCDEHMERQIPTRIFDFSTNKKIFNQLLILQSAEKWQSLWTKFSKSSKRPLKEEEVADFSARSIQAVISFLNKGASSKYVTADPTGADRLRLAHQLRRYYKSNLSKKGDVAEKVESKAKEFSLEPFTHFENVGE